MSSPEIDACRGHVARSIGLIQEGSRSAQAAATGLLVSRPHREFVLRNSHTGIRLGRTEEFNRLVA